MNRKNIDNKRFVDFDEFISLEIVDIQFADKEGDNILLREGFRVDGLTKTGLRVEGLFVEKQSKTNERCYKFIMDNWVNKK